MNIRADNFLLDQFKFENFPPIIRSTLRYLKSKKKNRSNLLSTIFNSIDSKFENFQLLFSGIRNARKSKRSKRERWYFLDKPE